MRRPAWVRRAAGLFGGARAEQEFADELAAHLEMHTDDNIRQGMSPEEARRAAVVKLGGVQSVRQRHREQRGIPALEHLARDLRGLARTFRRSPGFTVLALVTIAFGVAGPTVMFAMAKTWILDPLPFARPGDLLDVRHLDSVSGDIGSVNAADYLDWQRDARSFEGLAAYRRGNVRLTGGERAESARGARVTPDFFNLLGAHAAEGRVFDASDAHADRALVTVISHGLWQRRFQGDAAIVGRPVRLEGEDYTVVGILPADFQFTLLGAVDVWRPLIFTPAERANRRPRQLNVLGRLREGRTIDQARSELAGLARQLSSTYPDTNARRSVRVVTLAEEVRLHHDAGFVVDVLFAMMCCVLLVACVNVTNVMLARATTRRQDVAVRVALGASRAQIVRQWLVEHIGLFVVASALGAALAVYGADWVSRSIPPENRQFLRHNGVLIVDRVTLVFALAVGAVCGAIFGWLPAWTSARADVNRDLRDATARTTASKVGSRIRGTLVTVEVAVTLAMMISAGLLVATGRNIASVDVGFNPRSLLTFQLALDPAQYREPSDIRGFYERVTADLARLPGVTSAAAGSLVPFGTEGSNAELFIDGVADPAPADTPVVALDEITADYPRTLGLGLRSGRLLNAGDGADAPRVALINETLARRYFPDRDPLGQRVRLRRGANDAWQIVGVVGNVKNFETIDAEEPEVYVPFAQSPRRVATVVLRATGDPASLVAGVRAAVAARDPAEPVSDVATMEDRIKRVTAPYDIIAAFVAVFGAVTLLLAGVGVYGVVSYSFAQRTREMAIRLALGASRTSVIALLLRQLRTVLLAGVLPGLVLAALLGQSMKALLVGVTPTDWRLYLGMSVLLTLVALLAALAPARRATAIDPTVALRYE